ncbi:MAG: tetratricopeptide repeat protein, partial [Desulfovibrio sp.]
MILAIGACRTLRFLHWHVLFLIAAGLLYPVQGQAQLQEIPHTVAHEILAIEAELGNSLDSSILDAIIREAAVHIPRKPSYTRQEALDILTTIFDITIEKGFLYKASSFTLGQSLTPRHLSGNEIELLSSYDNLYRSFVQSDLMYFHHYCPGCVLYLDRERQEPVVMTDPGGRYYFTQCATLSFIYLAVAETLDLPMQALSLPLHIAIRWQLDDGTYINWQPLNGRQESDEQMARSYAIDPSLISSGVYLRSLTRNEVLALGWFLVGVAWMERNDTFHAQYAMENSLFLDDFHPLTHYHLGVIHHTNEQYLTALHHYTQSLALDDTFARTHLGRGWSFFRLGEYEEAAQDFSRSLQIDGNLAEAYMGLGWAYYKRGNNEAAVVEFNKALELNPELPSAYIGRSAALDALGRSDEARADMDMADNLEQHPTSLSGAGNGSGQDQEDILTQVEALDVQMT